METPGREAEGNRSFLSYITLLTIDFRLGWGLLPRNGFNVIVVHGISKRTWQM